MKTRFNVALVANSAPEVPRWVVERLEDQNIDLMYRECTTKEELKETAANAEVVWVMGGSRVISAEALHLFKKCGAILRTGSGTDNIPVEQATALGIIVVNTPEATAEAVAEHTIGLLFGVTRRIAFHDRRIRTGVWDVNKNLPDCHLAGQVLGLVGCGHIAQLVARRLTGFEMSILGFDPFVPQESMKNHGVREAALEQLIVESDFVSLHCPLTASTRNLINKERLRMMKRRAILINTSRGHVVHEPSLFVALSEGWIAGAGLDVLWEEPPRFDNPLLQLDNVVITPHIAGYSDRFLHNMWRSSIDAIVDLSHGHWPSSWVNKDVKPLFKLRDKQSVDST